METSFRFLFPLIAAIAIPWSAAAQNAERDLYLVDSVGDIQKEKTPHAGRIHLHGTAEIGSADYFRGIFDDVPEDGDWTFQPTLGMSVELGDVWAGSDLTLTLGMENGLSDDDPFDDADGPSRWYEANPYFGLNLRHPSDLVVGLTYSIYSSPNDVSKTSEELALAALYAGEDILGDLSPSLKIAVPVHRGSGVYLETGVNPELNKLLGWQTPIRTFVPVTVGVGLNEYYEDELGSYISFGLDGSMPLAVQADYGNWTVDAGLTVLLRQDDLKEIGEPHDNGGNTVLIGTVGVSFVY